ncbi:MAG: efflux RND transporter permease subunit [Pseudomonadota bacterium]|nr:efflux RND transporter permease subunit [Pseudomonadota bacterium]
MVTSDPPGERKDEPAGRHEGLGVAGGMAKSFIHSPLTPLLLVASLAIGILGLLMTPRQEDPQISVPMVDIFVQYPGASAKQVASLVADPLQRIMSEITGVKHVYSASMRGGAMVTVQFVVGEDMEASLVKLYDKLESNMDKIPPGVSPPLVKPKSVDDVPIVTLTLWSNQVDDATLNLVALDVLQRLNEVPNTSQGFVVRGRSEQVRIEVKPDKLEGFGITLGRIANTIQTANSERGVGDVEYGGTTLNLYTGAFLETRTDIEQLVLSVKNGRPVYVRDVADVIWGPSETHGMVRYYTGSAYPLDHMANGESAVTIAIAKKKGSNGVIVAHEILEKVEYLKGRIIPDNVEVSVTRNYGQTARDKVNELIFKLFVATAAVAVLVLLFLGLRAAIVVVIVIPVVILVTVFSAWVLDYTIDRVSLFALIFSIGILVDDAIVVVENIYRRWLIKGASDTATAVDAVREVGNPTILATFTVIAALLPMGFVSGMMGPYMEPIPALGSVAMLFSLFAAFIFTPWLTMSLKPSMEKLHKAEEKEVRQQHWLGRLYRNTIVPLIERRVLGLGFLITIIVVFFLCCVMFYTEAVRVKMLPLDNKPEFNVVINMPEGTALPVTANLANRAANVLRRMPEVTAVQTYVGTASPYNFNGLVRHYYLRERPWMGDLQVQLLDKHDRDRTSHEIAVEAREMLTPMAEEAGGRIQVVEMPPGPPVLQTLVAEIYGPTPEIRRQVAGEMTRLFEEAPSIADVDNYLESDNQRWHFDVNREKALRLGVSVEEINNSLEMAMGGFSLGDIKTQSLLEPTHIVLQLPLAVRADFSRLSQLPIMTASGRSVPLAEFGQFRSSLQDKPIYMKDLRHVEYVIGEGVGYYAAPIYGILQVQGLLKDYTTPDGVVMSGDFIGPPAHSRESGFEWAGEWTVTYETFRDMGIAFGAALVLIYMLVVWEFGNFIQPAIVVAPIPLTLIGIIPGHWLLDAEFTATSMIGFIALAGIIVRNSILLVDFTKHEVNAGISVVDAVINACKARTRPIIITALALVAGSSVILFDPIFQGMAISLLFGVLVSTLLTLLVIPLGCISASKSFEACEPDDGSGAPAAVPAGSGLSPDAGGGEPAPASARNIPGTVFHFTYQIIYTIGLYLYLIVKGIIQGSIGLVRAVTGRLGSKQVPGARIETSQGTSPGLRTTVAKSPPAAGKAVRSPAAGVGETGGNSPVRAPKKDVRGTTTGKSSRREKTPAATPSGRSQGQAPGAKRTGSAKIESRKAKSAQPSGVGKQPVDAAENIPFAKVNGESPEGSGEAPARMAGRKKGRRGIRLKADLNER